MVAVTGSAALDFHHVLAMLGEEGFGGGLAEVEELGADLVGGCLVEVVEQVAGMVPGGAGRVRVTGSVVAGAQMGEGAGFGVAVA